MIDFQNTLIRCSSLGAILTEPQAKAAKDAGELSKTAKTALIGTYIREVYGREKDITTKQMSKGIIGEDKGIELLSRHQGEIYSKNETRYNNEYLTGHPDIITQDNRIIDTKLSFDLWTFLPNITEPLNKDYFFQLQGYFWLCNAQSGAVAYILADCPESIIEQEKYFLLKKMNVISEESPEYIEAAAKLEINLIYPDIPLNEKVLILKVDRDEEVIEKIKQKVIKCREFLQEFSEIHKNFNK